MRSLSEREVNVVGVLLADSHRNDAEGERLARVPRTTFQSIRRRAILGGWLMERYVPHPSHIDHRQVVFRIVQPFAERWPEAIRSFTALDTVLLWAFPDTLFSIEFASPSTATADGGDTLDHARQSWSMTVEAGPSTIFAYFDYEGIWARWAQGTNPIGYPRTFKQAQPVKGRDSTRDPREHLNNIRALVLQPSTPGAAHSGRLSLSQGRLPRKLRKLIESGEVFRRFIPDFNEMPPTDGNRLSQFVFVNGQLRDGRSASQLFEALTGKAKIAPFLFASDGSKVLLASLGPAPASLQAVRTSPLSVLTEHLEEIVIAREPIGSMLRVVDHEYDRPLRAALLDEAETSTS